MSETQVRSKTIVLVAAVATNKVIGLKGKLPWHLPADFEHFKRTTLHQTVLMGRSTFESIGRPLPNRSTIVLSRDPKWSHEGTVSAHSLQQALDLAEDLPGNLMVVGGSHIYAELLPLAQMQVISEIDLTPDGDAFYPTWDSNEWLLSGTEDHQEFSVKTWTRRPKQVKARRFIFDATSALGWWSSDWQVRLAAAVENQRTQTSSTQGEVNWNAVHQAAMKVIIEAAEDQLARGPQSSPPTAREVRLNRHLSLQDLKAVQGALFHWSDYISPRSQRH